MTIIPENDFLIDKDGRKVKRYLDLISGDKLVIPYTEAKTGEAQIPFTSDKGPVYLNAIVEGLSPHNRFVTVITEVGYRTSISVREYYRANVRNKDARVLDQLCKTEYNDKRFYGYTK